MRFKFNLHGLVALLALALASRADELTDKGRAVFLQHQRAVVTVQVVQKISAGGTSESREAKQDITGTVMDPSGLTVLALSSVDPGEMYKRMYPGTKVETEVSDLKILIEDGAEVPAEIVLRDKDLDLAFIRPKSKPASPMAAVDFSKTTRVDVLDQVITLNRLGRAAGRAYSASVEHISAVVLKPRTFYIPDSTMTATTSGSPAFALDGNLVGLFVMRVTSVGGGGGGFSSRSDNVTSIILPAEDVLKAAKQAPEAKGDEPNKEPAKETKAEPEKK